MRRRAEDKAREVITQNLGELTKNQIKQIVDLLNTDYFKGKIRRQRFGLMLWGRNFKLIMDNDEKILNQFFFEVFVKENLDEVKFLIANLKGVGRGFVSCILYLKNREKYNIFTNATSKGIKVAFPKREQLFYGPLKERYLHFNTLANELKKEYRLKPQEMDIVLTSIPYFVSKKLLDDLLNSYESDVVEKRVLELVYNAKIDINIVVNEAIDRIESGKFDGSKWSTLALSILDNLGWPNKAGEILEALVKYDEESAYLNNYGVFMLRRGHFGQTIQYFSRAYAIDYKHRGHEKASNLPAWKNLLSITSKMDKKSS